METSSESNEIYTLGIWIVKPGNEDKFISEWTTFANATSKTYIQTSKAYLLRDENNPQRFISFGAWDEKATIDRWRKSEAFQSFVATIMDLCDDFQPNTLKIASTSE